MFISLEGCNSSGKKTQATLLYKNLKKIGKGDVILTSFSGKTVIGESIKRLLESVEAKEATLENILLLHLTSIIHLNKTIIWPNLKKKRIVICNQHIDYSFAYQGIWGRDTLKIEKIYETLSRELTPEIPEEALYPDFTFILDVDPQESRKRNKESNGKIIEVESLYKQEILREQYLKLAKEVKEFWGEKFFFINANYKIPKVSKKIISITRYLIDNQIDPVIDVKIHPELFSKNKLRNLID